VFSDLHPYVYRPCQAVYFTILVWHDIGCSYVVIDLLAHLGNTDKFSIAVPIEHGSRRDFDCCQVNLGEIFKIVLYPTVLNRRPINIGRVL
jgi:hypothetical protein